jgi:hypothetical protein
MFVPFFTNNSRRLVSRKEGRSGGGIGTGGKSGDTGVMGSRSASKIAGVRNSKSVPLSSTSPKGGDGGKPLTVPSGSPFAGRPAGGGTRDEVFGSR